LHFKTKLNKKQMGKTIIKETCRKCKGDGVVLEDQLFFGVMTFGIFTAFDKVVRGSKKNSMFANRCPKCNGKGLVITKTIESN